MENSVIAARPAGSSTRASRNITLTACAATNMMPPTSASQAPMRPGRLAPTAPLRANPRRVTRNKAWVRPQVSVVAVAKDPENGKLSRSSGTVEMPRYTAADADRVDGLVADLAATIEELRRLTDRLPPPQLDSGIAAAFRELAGRAPIPVIVDADPERLDRSLETTAYFVGCEGLTNVIKHARATAVTMRAVRRNGSLLVSVADDGVGGARAWEGSGLAGLADRVAAVGGRLHIESGTQGTLLTAEFPCG